jgi:hypothetical protein
MLKTFAARDITPLLEASDIEIDRAESKTGHQPPRRPSTQRGSYAPNNGHDGGRPARPLLAVIAAH